MDAAYWANINATNNPRKAPRPPGINPVRPQPGTSIYPPAKAPQPPGINPVKPGPGSITRPPVKGPGAPGIDPVKPGPGLYRPPGSAQPQPPPTQNPWKDDNGWGNNRHPYGGGGYGSPNNFLPPGSTGTMPYQNPYGGGYGQQPNTRPPQGFGGGGYPQLPGGMQAPPWMGYMQQPSGGAGMGFGGGMQTPGSLGANMGQFQNGWQSPFQGPRYQQPAYRPMPTLPNTPGAPNMPTYYRPGAMPW